MALKTSKMWSKWHKNSYFLFFFCFLFRKDYKKSLSSCDMFGLDKFAHYVSQFRHLEKTFYVLVQVFPFVSKILFTCQPRSLLLILHSTVSLSHKKCLALKISADVFAYDLRFGTLQSKIMATPMRLVRDVRNYTALTTVRLLAFIL